MIPQSESGAGPRKFEFLRRSLLVGLAASALVFGYEALDQLAHPPISTWHSQAIVIIIGGGAVSLLTLGLLRASQFPFVSAWYL